MKIVVVIPAYNEEKEIRTVLDSLENANYNVIVVDDASTDNTYEVAGKSNAVVLQHLINRGQGAALKTGLTYALQQAADIVVTFDADGQHQVADINTLVRPIIEKQAEVVLGSRFIAGSSAVNMPFYRKMILKMAIIFTRFASGLRITDTHNGLRAFSREALEKIRLKQDRMAHASEILDEIYKNKLSYKEVPVAISYTKYSITKESENKNPFAFGRILLKYLLGKILK